MRIPRGGKPGLVTAALVYGVTGCGAEPPPQAPTLRQAAPIVQAAPKPVMPKEERVEEGGPGAPRALNGSVWLYHVTGRDGKPTDYVSVLSPEKVFARGLSPEAIVGQVTRPLGQGEAITPESFARNRPFVDLLHEVVARHAPELEGLRSEARRIGEGWVYVIDARTATPRGKVPPQDIIGAFKVHAGRVEAGSYERNAKHTILSRDGFFRLDAALQERLLAELETRQAQAPPEDGKAHGR